MYLSVDKAKKGARMKTKRVEKLREQSVNTAPYISMERAQAVTRVYKEYLGSVSYPVLRALAFKEIMETKTICINEGELIVGERCEGPQATPTFPELCCHTLEDFDIMDSRDQISFKVSDEARRIQEEEIIPFWKNRSTRHMLLERVDDEWREAYAAGIFTEFMEQRGPGHTAGDGKIYKYGFLDFKEKIAKAIADLDFFTDPEAPKKKEHLKAMDIACDALIIQADRYADEAEKLAAACTDPVRKAELEKIVETCRRVPRYAPRTFTEAIQMYWFVHLGVVTELNPWDSYNPGRIDQHLYPFYARELADGSMTKEEAEEILQCFWIKFNNQPAPPKVGITLKESSTYFDFCTINVGGLNDEGEDGVNELSYLVLDVIREMRMLQPGSNVQISHKTPDAFLKKAIDITRTGYGQPSIFNCDMVIKELVNQGKDLIDARQGGTSGCVEAGAFGKEAYILTGYFNLPKILELTLHNGIDPQSGKQLGLKTGEVTDFTSYEELLEAYTKQLKHFIDIKVRGNMIIGDIFSEVMQVPFLSVVTDDCISKGLDYNSGGARYNTSYIQGVGIANLTDSFSAIKYNIFDQQNFSWEELVQALKDNFAGHDKLHDYVYNRTPKYGNNDDYADAILVEQFDLYHSMVDGRLAPRGGVHHVDMLPTTCHVYFGSVISALPEGRKSGLPLADGISPSKGADRIGPTGVVASAAKMDHSKTGGTLLNQKFTPGIVAGEKGLSGMAALVRAYFRMGGHHIQFNVVSRETLIDAQNNPQEYENLIVRVAGYSDYFKNLDKVLQDEIIARTEQVI